MATSGWIKLHRKLMENDLWQSKPFSKGQAWVDLLMLANYEDKEAVLDGKSVLIKRGSFVTSIRKLAQRWGWSRTKTARYINDLKKSHMVITKSDTKKTTLEIVNYSEYQAFDEESENEKSHKKGHKKATNRDTKKTPKDTTKEIKNISTISKEKKEKPAALFPPDDEDEDPEDDGYWCDPDVLWERMKAREKEQQNGDLQV